LSEKEPGDELLQPGPYDGGKLPDDKIGVFKRGVKIVLVTSGAVASGMAELDAKFNPNDLVFKQVCAAAGQSILMAHYREFFKRHGLKVAQILLTKEDLSNRASYVHTCNVLDRLLRLGVVPIVNENDVTSVDELKPVTEGYGVNFSDNDILAVLIANAIQADLVVLLSNVDGLYTMNPKNPEAELIPLVEKVTPELKASVEGKSLLGRGGMKTKLQAADISTRSGIPVVVANSFREGVLLDALHGKPVGTLFLSFQPDRPCTQGAGWLEGDSNTMSHNNLHRYQRHQFRPTLICELFQDGC
jgi:glutamate 5-kinase